MQLDCCDADIPLCGNNGVTSHPTSLRWNSLTTSGLFDINLDDAMLIWNVYHCGHAMGRGVHLSQWRPMSHWGGQLEDWLASPQTVWCSTSVPMHHTGMFAHPLKL